MITITQRAATVNKNLISQLSTLISFQLVAPQDAGVLAAWLDANGDEDGRAKVLGTVKQLEQGEAWVRGHNAKFLERIRLPIKRHVR